MIFFTILADRSADSAVLCLAKQGKGLRNQRLNRQEWSKMHFISTRIAALFFWYFWLTIQNTANRQVRNLFLEVS